jgi:predicted metal-binding membrane protein
MERGRLGLLLTLLVLTLAAWAVTIYQARTMQMPMGIVVRGGAPTPAEEPAAGPDEMAGMDDMAGMTMDEPAAAGMGTSAASGMAGMAEMGWSWGGFVAFFLAWVVMMAAMMFPAAAPMLLLFRTVSVRRQERGSAFVPTWVFAAGYLLVWAAIGALTWVLVQLGSDLASQLGATARATWGPLVLGGVLIVAGVYQLTPLKRVCLDHCRTPLGFVTRHWRDGPGGALQMGLIHGLYCLGCCWALFAVLVAAGVMSLAWMLLLTLIIFAEKVLPLGPRTSQVVGIGFLIGGILVAAGAADLPWMA